VFQHKFSPLRHLPSGSTIYKIVFQTGSHNRITWVLGLGGPRPSQTSVVCFTLTISFSFSSPSRPVLYSYFEKVAACPALTIADIDPTRPVYGLHSHRIFSPPYTPSLLPSTVDPRALYCSRKVTHSFHFSTMYLKFLIVFNVFCFTVHYHA
jgi:hypothetical protein